MDENNTWEGIYKELDLLGDMKRDKELVYWFSNIYWIKNNKKLSRTIDSDK
jgi:hypothetical protein